MDPRADTRLLDGEPSGIVIPASEATDMRVKIMLLQAEIGKLPDEFACDPPVQHHHAYKVYGREIVLPKGSLVVGKIHRNETLNIIASGDVSVLTENGVQRYKGPTTFVSAKGAKRVVFAHEETYWVTAHGTEKTDLVEIEDEVIAPSYDHVPAILEAKALQTLEG